MNLFFRLLWIYFSSMKKPSISLAGLSNQLNMCVLINDLDLNLHMNNGRFLTICDLNRFDLFIRTGLLKVMRKNRWSPLISEHTMEYKKSLKLFQKYVVTMQITHWDDKFFYATHQFIKDNKVVASGTSKAVIRSRDGIVPTAQVLAAVEQLQRRTQ